VQLVGFNKYCTYIYYILEPLAHNCEPVRAAGQSQVLITSNSVVSQYQNNRIHGWPHKGSNADD